MIHITDNILDTSFVERTKGYLEKVSALGEIDVVKDGTLYELLNDILKNEP